MAEMVAVDFAVVVELLQPAQPVQTANCDAASCCRANGNRSVGTHHFLSQARLSLM